MYAKNMTEDINNNPSLHKEYLLILSLRCPNKQCYLLLQPFIYLQCPNANLSLSKRDKLLRSCLCLESGKIKTEQENCTLTLKF